MDSSLLSAQTAGDAGGAPASGKVRSHDVASFFTVCLAPSEGENRRVLKGAAAAAVAVERLSARRPDRWPG